MNTMIIIALSGIVGGLIGLFGGLRWGQTIVQKAYEQDKAMITAQYEQALADQAEKSNETINLLKEELSEHAKLYYELQSTTDRLRNNLTWANNRLDEANDSCRAERASLGKCQELLIEGTELLGKGAYLLRKTATNNDALIKTIEVKTTIE